MYFLVFIVSVASLFGCYYLWCTLFVSWLVSPTFNLSFVNAQILYSLTVWFDGISMTFGLDSISLFLVTLTTVIMILSYWYSLGVNVSKPGQFLSYLFLIHFLLVVAFTVNDSVFFYIFFESILIPMFIIIGRWGSRDRRIKSNYYFFLYTLLGSLFMLAGLMYLYVSFSSTTYDVFLFYKLPAQTQYYLWVCFFLPFAIKTPMLPFHIWLPEAHVEAPTVGSVILAALLLKLGGYGFIRFTIPLFKIANTYFSPLIYCMAMLSVVYASLITIRQIDLKRIIAYSSIAHMNLVVLGLFSYTVQGFEGSLYLMIAHGFVSAALFFLVGIVYARTHSRLVNYYGGLSVIMPKFSFFFINLSLANMAFPGSSNFIGEFLVMLGIFEKNTLVLVISALSIIFSAIYSIWLFNRVCFGPLKSKYFNRSLFWKLSLTSTEVVILGVLVGMSWVIGISSDFILISDVHLFVVYVFKHSVLL